MLKLSRMADYATVLMTAIAAEPARVHNGQELAARTHVPAPTVAKLLKALARGGLLESQRGARGGYKLARDPARLSVAEIIRVLEGPIGVTECSTHGGDCGIESHCATRANWRLINTAIRQALEAVTLAQMVVPLKRTAEAPLRFRPPASAATAEH